MTTANRVIWVDNSSKDPAATKAFYARVFTWDMVTDPDPQYGGYTMAKMGGTDVAGFGGQMDPNMPPSVWNLYVGTPDAAATAAAATDAGGTVIVPPFPVGTAGIMSFIQDPSGAVIGIWQAGTMTGFIATGDGAFDWAELTARGIDRAVPFYDAVFGWGQRIRDMPDGLRYTVFVVGEDPVAGGMEMPEMVPAEVPSYWMPYFQAADVSASFATAIAAGAREIVAPHDIPGGRFAIVADPQGGLFGLIRME